MNLHEAGIFIKSNALIMIRLLAGKESGGRGLLALMRLNSRNNYDSLIAADKRGK